MKKSLSVYKLLFFAIMDKKFIGFLFIFLSFISIVVSFILSFHLKFLETVHKPLELTMMFILVQIISASILYFKTVLQNKLIRYLEYNFNSRVIEHIFNLPIRYLKNKRIGEIAKKIEESSKVKESIINMLFVSPMDLFLIVIVLIGMFSLSTDLSFIYIISISIYIFITLFTKKTIYKLNHDNIESYEEYTSNLIEYLSGLTSIKNIGCERVFLNNINKVLDRHLENNSIFTLQEAFLYIVKNKFLEIVLLLITFIGFISIDADFTIIDLMTFISLTSLLQHSLENMITSIINLYKNKINARNVSEFLDVLEEHKGLECAKDFSFLKIINLSFSYDNLNYVIKNISLVINKGEKILLNGSSGRGKSTLVKCITNIIDNYEGNILLNGINIKDISVESLRKNIIYIGQEETLFRSSIRENIVIDNYDKERFEHICKITKVDEILIKRAEKENTILLEGASNISGGEKSRIILARALYRNPSLLIIDETLSSVNEKMEDEILESLLRIEKLSIIYITHRNKKKYFNKVITI